MMKKFSFSLFLAILMTLAISCKKKGCTNFHSENFNSNAVVDDGSCIYLREKVLGQFEITEPLLGGNTDTTYVIEIVEGTEATNQVVISALGSGKVKNVKMYVTKQSRYVVDLSALQELVYDEDGNRWEFNSASIIGGSYYIHDDSVFHLHITPHRLNFEYNLDNHDYASEDSVERVSYYSNGGGAKI